jgi:hypothetical protein
VQQLSPRMQRIQPPVGKDVTAFWQAGGRVRDWVRFELGAVPPAPYVGLTAWQIWIFLCCPLRLSDAAPVALWFVPSAGPVFGGREGRIRPALAFGPL